MKSVFIHKRREEFVELAGNRAYRDVYFDEFTGALRATHIEHHFDLEKGHYEEEVVVILYKNGNKVILESEKNAEGIKTPDGTLNDRILKLKR